MSSLDIEQARSPDLSDQTEISKEKFSIRDPALFDLLKNSNFEEFNELLRQFKSLNVLQESSNSPDSNKQQKQNDQIQGKENNKIFRQIKQEKKYISEAIEMDICSNQRIVDFGTCLPGYVLEESLVLHNIGNLSYKVKATVLCYDDELNELDEYVFSIRSQDNFEYSESLVCKVHSDERIQLFVAVKVPNLKTERKIHGTIQIKVIGAGLCGLLEKPIQAMINIPKITCLKELFSSDYQQSVIKLAMKINSSGKSECKIPFKNLNTFNVKAEYELIYEKKSDDELEFSISPDFGMMQSNTMSMIGLVGRKIERQSPVVRNRNSMRSQLFSQLEKITKKKSKKTETKYEKNMIILLKVMNSSVILCYPTIVEIY